MPHPSHAERTSILHLPTGDFKMSFDNLYTKVITTLQAKTIGGIVCDGGMMVEFLEQCTKNINDDGNIEIPSVVGATLDAIWSRFAEAGLEKYKYEMSLQV